MNTNKILLWKLCCLMFLKIYNNSSDNVSECWLCYQMINFPSKHTCTLYTLRNKHRGTLIDFWNILKKTKKYKWPQCLDWCKKVLKSWCKNFLEGGLRLFQGVRLFQSLEYIVFIVILLKKPKSTKQIIWRNKWWNIWQSLFDRVERLC